MESNPIHDLAIIYSTLKPGHKVVHDFISGHCETMFTVWICGKNFQSWGCTQESLLIAQQKGGKVRFGTAAALSSHVLPVTILVGEELHRGARWRQQCGWMSCNRMTVKALVMLSSEYFACCAGSSVVNGIASWYTFWGETFCFLVVLFQS